MNSLKILEKIKGDKDIWYVVQENQSNLIAEAVREISTLRAPEEVHLRIRNNDISVRGILLRPSDMRSPEICQAFDRDLAAPIQKLGAHKISLLKNRDEDPEVITSALDALQTFALWKRLSASKQKSVRLLLGVAEE